jgi:2-oxoglutarate dehydrogenase E1 component
VLWEAQFGDFADGAQTIVDEFISSSEQKWGQRSSVVLLLPHGYEGQGPDHSSGRIERYLQLCAEDNMTVAVPSNPASYFHLLRWHAYHEPRRPLIVFSPKSMLRLKASAAAVEAFTSGAVRPVIPHGESGVRPEGVRRVLLCSGKVYWDLLSERAKRANSGGAEVAIVRVEQLAPLPAQEIVETLAAYPAQAELVWVQEEPANQGPWPFVALNLPAYLGGRQLACISRPPAASPAAGSHHKHDEEQTALVERALAL